MSIITARRISQSFFLVLFLWFCGVTALGQNWWQLRGWPVNWILQLDPLVGLGTLVGTHTLYKGLWWGVVTLVLTMLLGRFFCGWICPFGTVHQFVGFLARRKRRVAEKAGLNRFHRLQAIKYWLLIFFLAAALSDLGGFVLALPKHAPKALWLLVAAGLAGAVVLAVLRSWVDLKRLTGFCLMSVGLWALLAFVFKDAHILKGSLQSGLFDPIPLFHRSINLILLPIAEAALGNITIRPRFYDGAWLIGTVFFAAILLNLKSPRFYCRYICPLGALFGLLSTHAVWRIGKNQKKCTDCMLCETDCEGACSPASVMRPGECVLCLNCMGSCPHDLIGYRTAPSAGGEVPLPDLSRRSVVTSVATGIFAIPLIRTGGVMASNWNPRLVRPPGALAEDRFLSRCVKCGQCMRVCPTNVLQPAFLEAGLEGLWTPVLNFRIGTSGCQHTCVACGNLCPTAAIRPIHPDERMGKKEFTEKGPIRIGTAFVDRGRCLPWAMDRPCIVCQENCPVSPKAIFTRVYYSAVQSAGRLKPVDGEPAEIAVTPGALTPGRFATGDYVLAVSEGGGIYRRRIVGNTTDRLIISPGDSRPRAINPDTRMEIQVRLQRVYVDVSRCIGCGICEHECPVAGKRAIRVTAENETRNRDHALLLNPVGS